MIDKNHLKEKNYKCNAKSHANEIDRKEKKVNSFFFIGYADISITSKFLHEND
jgi:hypothetical protein